MITFEKVIGGGVFPFAGAILRNRYDALCSVHCTVMQSHTYAGASICVLMTAAEVSKKFQCGCLWFSKMARRCRIYFDILG